MKNRELAERIAEHYEDWNPWEFYDVWESKEACIESVENQLEDDPKVLLDEFLQASEDFGDDSCDGVLEALYRLVYGPAIRTTIKGQTAIVTLTFI